MDSSFQFQQRFQDVSSLSTGFWKLVNKNLILLKNNEQPMRDRLQSGYSEEKEKVIYIKGKNKLALNNIVLERIM